MKILLLVPAVCLMVCSCANTKPNCPVRFDRSQNETSPADWEITLGVKEAILFDGYLSASNRFVSVSTTDGIVTLSGNVSGMDQMNEIVRRVQSVCGVIGVNNQMTVSYD